MLAFTCLSPMALATEPAAKTPARAMPSADFLEFLAEMKQVDGKWVSAIDLANQDVPVNSTLKPSKAANLPGKSAEKAQSKSATVPEPKP